MSEFKIDRFKISLAVIRAVDEALGIGAPVCDATVAVTAQEIANQLRPHVPGAREADDLETLLRRLIATTKVDPAPPIADPVERAAAVATEQGPRRFPRA